MRQFLITKYRCIAELFPHSLFELEVQIENDFYYYNFDVINNIQIHNIDEIEWHCFKNSISDDNFDINDDRINFDEDLENAIMLEGIRIWNRHPKWENLGIWVEIARDKDSIEEFAVKLIDMFIDKRDELNFAWSYGEESILLHNIVNLINDAANIDYKRFGRNAYDNYKPKEELNFECLLCLKHWSVDKTKNNCLGKCDGGNCLDFDDRLKNHFKQRKSTN